MNVSILILLQQILYYDAMQPPLVPSVALSYNSAYFGGSTHIPIVLDNLQCQGNETNVTQCSYDAHTADCTHSEDAGVKCYDIDGQIAAYSVLYCIFSII